MDALKILQTKRRNEHPHTREELEWWIQEYTAGKIPDYQMSAWLMAICWRGMTADETAILTKCMVDSGTKLEWKSELKPFLVDKHSTGGVGDKISLILAPLVASLGGKVPMMAGRGLGHSGGTIDKLESIPGFQTNLSISDFQTIVETVGCSIVSASSELCLADRKLYALRDVTATVTSIPLQTSSIMCKKIAEHPESLVLDVKYGTASFQSNVDDAQILAHSMIATGEANGLVPTTCFLTHMDSVIGTCVGNWLEVEECITLLKTGKGSPDLIALVVVQSAQMLQHLQQKTTTTENTKSWDELVQLVYDTLCSGKAFEYFERMVEAQGGDISVLQLQEGSYPHVPKFTKTVVANQSGFISKIDGLVVGTASVQLGAGRLKSEDGVDPIAGMKFHVKEGDAVEIGTEICTVQTNISMEILDRVCHTLQDDAIEYSKDKPNIPFCISHKVTSSQGVEAFEIPACLLQK